MNEDERIASKRFGNEKLLQKVNMDNIETKKRLNISQVRGQMRRAINLKRNDVTLTPK
jgi:hypothetical protein